MSNSLQEVVALFGYPVAGNPTQYLMEKACARAGLDWRYLTFEVAPELLADAMRGARAMGFRGGNLTMPHKVAALPLFDELTDSARLIGAVNCWKRDGERLIGDNTDGRGFVQSLRTLVDPAEKRFVVLGAGGAARAIAVELALAKAANIIIVNRPQGGTGQRSGAERSDVGQCRSTANVQDLSQPTPEPGQDLANLLVDQLNVPARFVPWHGDFQLPAETDVLVNATSIGFGDGHARVPLALGTLRPNMVVADVTINPPRTRLLREAVAQECRTLDGIGMLVNQAAIAFQIWTGLETDTSLLREDVEEYLNL